MNRPSARNARDPQIAFDEAHAYAGELLTRLQARQDAAVGRQDACWGAVGSTHHLIDLLEQALAEG
jgi:hypothetical protein